MQKREQGKLGGAGGGSATQTPKRGRPFGSVNNSTGLSSATADSVAPQYLLGPSLQIHSSFAEQNNKRIVLALQSGLKSELTWALNTLTLLSFKEKDEMRRDATPLAKIPGLLDALLQVIDDWHDMALPRELQRAPRVRTLGTNTPVSGFGNEYEALGVIDAPSHPGSQKSMVSRHPSEWWFDEDGLFNLDEEGRSEKQQCAVAASNVIRNFSFMPDNEVIMAQHRHCLETVFQCVEDHNTGDEELVTNALETIVNLAPLLDLRIFSSSKPSYIKITEKRAVQAIMGILCSSVKTWNCAAAELLGRLIINPDNEPFLLAFAPQIYKRLVDLLSVPAIDAQAAAVGALYNLSEVNMDCRLKLASERWAVDRLLKVIRTPHPVHEVCRKSALILESLVGEPQNKALLLAYENAFSEILFSDSRQSDTFARILFELTSKPNNKVAAAQGIWGM
ncbi:armadillo repeat-containing protein LFR-like isoform X2 [Papaver somniferum]|uniref:armadillo repeat-containing protein LFR-like isoform X2 n=1 Tax=Papaver somniferum TaxID=3469 RepID=UPI000E6FE424|nr:armadillo repeat-containing protein LFR-like isoform X2 [Papaver somniferum]